jgi:SAM-dependent methyltransferase
MDPPVAPPNPARPADPDDVRRRWDTNAAWWDGTVGEGNPTQRLIIGPVTERLLAVRPGQRILDIACGNGHFARRMADLGASVLAVDFSEVFLAKARQRSAGYEDRVEYRSLDVARPGALESLSPGHLDAAVCTMALMDMAEIAPLFAGLARLLPATAPFVFSVTHPVFNQTGAVAGMERLDGPGGLEERYYVRIDRYASPRAGLGTGIVGQPTSHWYFERTISALLEPAFAAGFVVDAFEEVVCPEGMPANRPLSWASFHEIPPFLVVRLRRAATGAP